MPVGIFFVKMRIINISELSLPHLCLCICLFRFISFYWQYIFFVTTEWDKFSRKIIIRYVYCVLLYTTSDINIYHIKQNLKNNCELKRITNLTSLVKIHVITVCDSNNLKVSRLLEVDFFVLSFLIRLFCIFY